MYLKTLPIVSARPATGRIPESDTLTSVFLPIIAEKGLGVPVRSIAGDYLEPLCRRVNRLCDVNAVSSILDVHRVHRLRTFQVRSSAALNREPPTRAKIISDFLVDVHTRADLIELLLAKEAVDVAWVGLQAPDDCQRELFLPEHRVYLQLIHGLEETGVLRGIQYDYDVFYSDGRVPAVADIRTLFVDRYRILDYTSRKKADRIDLLNKLEEGREIDADAAPLWDFFHTAYELDDPKKLKQLQFESRNAVGRYVGGRTQDIAQVTVVKAY